LLFSFAPLICFSPKLILFARNEFGAPHILIGRSSIASDPRARRLIMASPQDEQLKVYEQLCNSYRAIDDFRAKLLGFLPLATGTGVFLLVTDQAKIKFIQPLFRPIGAFGFIVTLGLFFYELYGIKKCTYLIRAGIELENDLRIKDGQFTKRPPGVALL